MAIAIGGCCKLRDGGWVESVSTRLLRDKRSLYQLSLQLGLKYLDISLSIIHLSLAGAL